MQVGKNIFKSYNETGKGRGAWLLQTSTNVA